MLVIRLCRIQAHEEKRLSLEGHLTLTSLVGLLDSRLTITFMRGGLSLKPSKSEPGYETTVQDSPEVGYCTLQSTD